MYNSSTLWRLGSNYGGFFRKWRHVEGHKFSFVHLNIDRPFEMDDKCEICFSEEEINCHGVVIFFSRWELFALDHQRTLLMQQWMAKMAHLRVQCSLSDNLLEAWRQLKSWLGSVLSLCSLLFPFTLIALSILILFLQEMLPFVYQMRDFTRLNSFYIKDR